MACASYHFVVTSKEATKRKGLRLPRGQETHWSSLSRSVFRLAPWTMNNSAGVIM